MVARVAEGAGAGEEVADFGGLIDEGAGLGAVRDVGAVEGVLEEGERRTRGDQDGDVAGLRGSPVAGAVVVHLPVVAQRLLDDCRDVTRLAFTEDGGLRAGEVVVRLGAEDGDARAGGGLVVGPGRRGYDGGRGVVAVAPEREYRGEVAQRVAGVSAVRWGDRGAWCGRCGGVLRGDEVVEEREVVVGVVEEGELVTADRGGGAGIGAGWSS